MTHLSNDYETHVSQEAISCRMTSVQKRLAAKWELQNLEFTRNANTTTADNIRAQV